jgi:hypothetical protein
MRKLRLQLDDLRIDSFDTTQAKKARGTVFGEQCTCYTQCTCPGCPSCDESCNGTCEVSCFDTCAGSCNGTCYKTCNGCNTTGGYTCAGYATTPDPENMICVFC